MSYDQLIKAIVSGFAQFSILDLIDIIIIAILLYRLIVWTKETRAYEVLKGVGLLFLCSVASQLLSLNAISWVLSSILNSGTIIIVLFILFQPEIRRMLERLGRSGKRLGQAWFDSTTLSSSELVRDVHRAIMSLSRRRVGMLFVVEQKTSWVRARASTAGSPARCWRISSNPTHRCTTARSLCAAARSSPPAAFYRFPTT